MKYCTKINELQLDGIARNQNSQNKTKIHLT